MTVLSSEPIKVKDSHFSRPRGSSDLLRAPSRFPVPQSRVVLREISVVWHLYGGKDLGSRPLSVHAQHASRCVGGGVTSLSSFLSLITTSAPPPTQRTLGPRRCPGVTLSFRHLLPSSELLEVGGRQRAAAHAADGDPAHEGQCAARVCVSHPPTPPHPLLLYRCPSSTSPTWCQRGGRRGRAPWACWAPLPSSPCPGRCSSSRSWRYETAWPPPRSTSSSTCTPARACPAGPTPTWWGSVGGGGRGGVGVCQGADRVSPPSS